MLPATSTPTLTPALKSPFSPPKRQITKGYTLIEVLIVVIVVGILAAIALPNFLNQAAKAKQIEAINNLALINRLQIGYFMENNIFATTLDRLGLGSLTGGTTSTSIYYNYLMASDYNPLRDIHAHADPKDVGLKAYVAGVDLYHNSSGVPVMDDIICGSDNPRQTPIDMGVPVVSLQGNYYTTQLTCLAGTSTKVR